MGDAVAKPLATSDLFPAAEPTGIHSRDRQDWLAARRSILTASNTAAVLGLHPFKSALELYVEMVSPQDEPEPTIDSPMFWGSALESGIFEAVSRYYGWENVPGGELLRSRRYPHLGATLDGAVRWEGAPWRVYEGKTTTIFRSKDWDEEAGEAPTHVIIQAQHQLLVTGADMAVVFCLVGGQRPVKIEIEANEELHALIIEQSEAFLDRVQRLDPPDPTEADTEALKKLYDQEDGSIVRLPDEAVKWTHALSELAEQKKAIEIREKYLKNLLRASIGNATWGVLPEPVGGQKFWRWQLQERAEHFVKASSSRVLRSLKNGPKVDDIAQLPEPSMVTELEQQLRASTQQQQQNVTPIARKRRKARR